MEIDVRKLDLKKATVIRVSSPNPSYYNPTVLTKEFHGVVINNDESDDAFVIVNEAEVDNLIEGLKLAKDLGWFNK